MTSHRRRVRAASGLLVLAGLCVAFGCSEPERADESPTPAPGASTANARTTPRVDPTNAPVDGWRGRVLSIEATADGADGLQIAAAGEDAFVDATVQAELLPGSTVRTGPSTRAVIKLSDGGIVTLDRDSELALRTDRPRAAELRRGQAVFDLPSLGDDAPHARVRLPTGEVELLGTKIAAIADAARSLVTVTRGRIAVADTEDPAEAGPGEEMALPQEGPAHVAVAPDLGAAIGWSELGQTTVTVPRGLGSLTAKQPGRAQDDPLRKVRTSIEVDIQGLMARTEVTEVFENPSRHTLEGVYRFPLPDDAQIGRLALLVDGELVEGAFVENRRAERIWQEVISEWRDPAWLRWQHGNQFELRIFPIEPGQTRQVTIGYTQRLQPTSDGRAYVYPMPVDLDGRLAVDELTFHAEVRGHDASAPVQVAGYDARVDTQQADLAEVSFSARDFRAGGDLVLRYRLPGAAPLRAVAWQDGSRPQEPAFVAMSLRPELPRADTSAPRDLLLVADRSYSRTGAAAALQADLIGGVIAEMDPRDRVLVVACNETCVPVGSPDWQHPDADTAATVKGALQQTRPEGATNLLEAVRVAGHLVRSRSGDAAARQPRIVMLTDGIASAGALDARALRDGTRSALAETRARLTIADLGGSRDALAQQALAEGGSGTVVSLEPEATLSAHALAILGRQYGRVLEDVTVELPGGNASFGQVLPSAPVALSAGEELLVVGRMTGVASGDVVVRGTLDGQPFEQRYPLGLQPSTRGGDAFAARLWAERRIRDLEMAGGELHRDEIVSLSQRFRLLTRHTSLLALESREMMREFGIDDARDAAATAWDASSAPTEVTASLAGEADAFAAAADEPLGGQPDPDAGLGLSGAGRGGGGTSSGSTATPIPTSEPFDRRQTVTGGAIDDLTDADAESEHAVVQPSAEPMPTTRSRRAKRDEAKTEKKKDSKSSRGRGKGRRWQPTVRIAAAGAPGRHAERLVDTYRAEVAEDPTSVTRRKSLVRALSLAERFDEARREAADWLALDPMDAEALVVSAEIEARLGHSARAERLLASAVDAQPRAKWLRERLADAYTAIDDAALACAHRVSLVAADARLVDPTADAGNCPLATDLSRFEAAAPGAARPSGMQASARTNKQPRGDVTITLDWSGDASNPQDLDLDLGLVASNGRYTTWLGGERGVTFLDVAGQGPEIAVMKHFDEGSWRVDVVRRDDGKAPVTATLTIKAHGETKRLPVTLTGRRATVATLGWR